MQIDDHNKLMGNVLFCQTPGSMCIDVSSTERWVSRWYSCKFWQELQMLQFYLMLCNLWNIIRRFSGSQRCLGGYQQMPIERKPTFISMIAYPMTSSSICIAFLWPMEEGVHSVQRVVELNNKLMVFVPLYPPPWNQLDILNDSCAFPREFFNLTM